MRKPKFKTVDVTALEWFDRANGNSYFAAEVVTDYGTKKRKRFIIPFQYGYGDHYTYCAMEFLYEKGLIPNDPQLVTALWQLRDHGVIVRTVKHERCLKRELETLSKS